MVALADLITPGILEIMLALGPKIAHGVILKVQHSGTGGVVVTYVVQLLGLLVKTLRCEQVVSMRQN